MKNENGVEKSAPHDQTGILRGPALVRESLTAFCHADRFLMITLPVCLWCKRPFRPRHGGSPQRFCCAGHRMAFWSTARRWASVAVASGLLSVDDIRNGAMKACTLLLEAGSLAPIPSPQQSAAVAPGERPDEANELPKDS